MYGLEETGVYISGFNNFVDLMVFPAAMSFYRFPFCRTALDRLFMWGVNKYFRPPEHNVVNLEADGELEGKPAHAQLRLEHANAYDLTAIPVMACLLQYLEGSLNSPGLQLMALAVEPARFFKDMERMGVKISMEQNT
jgi:saccharopine dehydrogenase (NAD+, L-lysine-forming)